MLHCTLTLRLPAELPEPKDTVQRLVDWISGKKDEEKRDEKLDAVLRANLTVFEQMLHAFSEAGFDDVISVVIDGKPAYLDTEEKIGDLQAALEGTVKSGMIEAGFQILRATFCMVGGGLRLLGEFRCQSVDPEDRGLTHAERDSADPAASDATIRISARPEGFDPRDDEGPRQYAARVREYIRDPAKLQEQRDFVIGVVEKLRKAIIVRFPGGKIRRTGATVHVIAPGARQVGRMRHLGFGGAKRSTVYCSLPTHERIGPYDDPITHHYYSPYQDLFHWIAVGEVLAGHWAHEWVTVLHPSGRPLFTGLSATQFDRSQLDVDRNAVRVNSEGHLVIDRSIPDVDTLDPVEAGNPHSPGWAGEQWAEDIDDDAE